MKEKLVIKVELKEDALKQRMDNNGRINRANFVVLSMEAKLVDFTESTNDRKTIQRGGGKLQPERSKDKEEREVLHSKEIIKMENIQNSMIQINDKEYVERVEAAFMKLDLDKDGFIDWNEFQQVAKHVDLNQARRIFETCDEVSLKQVLNHQKGVSGTYSFKLMHLYIAPKVNS